MSTKKILLIIAIFLSFLAIITADAYFYVSREIKTSFGKETNAKIFTISSGESVDQISVNMQKEGLIKNSLYLKIYLWKKGLTSSIKAGEYNLSGSMNIARIADIIAKGLVAEQGEIIMIPEGLTSREIEKILTDKKMLKKGEFLAAIGAENIKKFYPAYKFFDGKPSVQNMEGYLFPDTYKFYKDSSAEDMVKKMLNNFDVKLTPEMRQEISAQGKNIFQTLILASIVQEEANGEADMKIVAGIFLNRLAIGKALEADSTINFVTGKKMSQALFSDLEIDSPYNTYKYAGLPPGPIANPGLDAIKAVIWPQKSEYLYFLHSPEGKAVYSKTYSEHLKNRVKYLN